VVDVYNPNSSAVEDERSDNAEVSERETDVTDLAEDLSSEGVTQEPDAATPTDTLLTDETVSMEPEAVGGLTVESRSDSDGDRITEAEEFPLLDTHPSDALVVEGEPSEDAGIIEQDGETEAAEHAEDLSDEEIAQRPNAAAPIDIARADQSTTVAREATNVLKTIQELLTAGPHPATPGDQTDASQLAGKDAEGLGEGLRAETAPAELVQQELRRLLASRQEWMPADDIIKFSAPKRNGWSVSLLRLYRGRAASRS
jgi:hypothetical protein